RDPAAILIVSTIDLHFDRRDGARIQNAPNHAAGLKKEVVAGKTLRQALAKRLRIGQCRQGSTGEAAAELDAHKGGVRAIVRRVNRRPARRDTDVGQHQLQILGRDDFLSDDALDLLDLAFRLLNPRSAGGPQVNGEFAGIDLGEQFLPNPAETNYR